MEKTLRRLIWKRPVSNNYETSFVQFLNYRISLSRYLSTHFEKFKHTLNFLQAYRNAYIKIQKRDFFLTISFAGWKERASLIVKLIAPRTQTIHDYPFES